MSFKVDENLVKVGQAFSNYVLEESRLKIDSETRVLALFLHELSFEA